MPTTIRTLLPKRLRRNSAALALLIATTLAGAAPGLAQAPLPPCSLGETDWRTDPVFQANRHPTQRSLPVGELRCRSIEQSLSPMGADQLRVLRAKVFEASGSGDGIEQSVNLFVLTRESAAGPQVLARFLEPYDISRDQPYFHVLVHQRGDGALVELGEKVRSAYRISGDSVTRIDAHAWVEGIGAVAGPGWVHGPVRRVSFSGMRGFVSIFRAGSDDPGRPGSAFDEGKAIQVDLALDGDRLVSRGARVVDPSFIQDVEDWTAFVEASEEARRAKRRLPAGTEPCDIAGWSADPDPAGMNVRAAPNASARIVGKIPPPWKAPDRSGDTGETYRSEFRIAGYRDGWFLIRGISAPGVAYGERYPRNLPQPYRGQGWISARLVGAALANGNLPPGRLYLAPSPHAATRPALRQGEPVSTGDIVQRLHACSGPWGLVEIEGTRGWWTGICANQVTNCS
ncbi:MAG: hypothetical protein FD152_3719 [Xanthobacteraceae bacterium]|nr:MAG: hypothetical protein FD152_3719 [Xanthobacteraceae bacterium]